MDCFEDLIEMKSFQRAKGKTGVVFSAHYAFNPTNLAVETSLNDMFYDCHPLIAANLLQENDI